jgi:hypothetical protein
MKAAIFLQKTDKYLANNTLKIPRDLILIFAAPNLIHQTGILASTVSLK